MPTIAYVCERYGWTLDQTLKLPVKTMLAFSREARRIEASQSLDRLKIAIMNGTPDHKYFDSLKNHYLSIIYPDAKEYRSEPYSKVKSDSPGEDLGDPETKNKLRQMFSVGRRFTFGR